MPEPFEAGSRADGAQSNFMTPQLRTVLDATITPAVLDGWRAAIRNGLAVKLIRRDEAGDPTPSIDPKDCPAHH